MASERPFGRLAVVHHRRIKNPDLFSTNQPFLPLFPPFFSLSQVYIPVLPKESGWMKFWGEASPHVCQVPDSQVLCLQVSHPRCSGCWWSGDGDHDALVLCLKDREAQPHTSANQPASMFSLCYHIESLPVSFLCSSAPFPPGFSSNSLCVHLLCTREIRKVASCPPVLTVLEEMSNIRQITDNCKTE